MHQAAVKTLIKRGEYTTSFQLSELRLAEISGVCTTSKESQENAGETAGSIAGVNLPNKMLLEQALSLRKQMLVDKIVGDGWRMKKNADTIRKSYDAGQSLADLCLRSGEKKVKCVWISFFWMNVLSHFFNF